MTKNILLRIVLSELFRSHFITPQKNVMSLYFRGAGKFSQYLGTVGAFNNLKIGLIQGLSVHINNNRNEGSSFETSVRSAYFLTR